MAANGVATATAMASEGGSSILEDTTLIVDNSKSKAALAKGPPQQTDGKQSWTVSQEDLIKYVFESVMENIVHDVIVDTHRKEKIARMTSAAIELEQQAESASSSGDDHSKANIDARRFETEKAIMEHDKVYIKGNPLETVKDILCSTCKKPRLLYPTMGIGARDPEAGKEYCKRHPPIDMPGHDIYGIPFTNSSRAKAKAKANDNNSSQKETNGTPSGSFASTPGGTPPPASQEKKFKAPAIPNINCDNCGQKVAITRFAQHLSKCMGISGRASSRNAMAKMNNQSENGSRTSTPVPGFISSQENNKKRKNSNDGDEVEGAASKKRKYTKKPGLLKGAVGMVKSASEQSSLSNVDTIDDDEDELASTIGVVSKPKNSVGSKDGTSGEINIIKRHTISLGKAEDEIDDSPEQKWSQDIFDDDDMFKKPSFPGTGHTSVPPSIKRQRSENEDETDAKPKKKIKKDKSASNGVSTNPSSLQNGTSTPDGKKHGLTTSKQQTTSKDSPTKLPPISKLNSVSKDVSKRPPSSSTPSPMKDAKTSQIGKTLPKKPKPASDTGKRPPGSIELDKDKTKKTKPKQAPKGEGTPRVGAEQGSLKDRA